MMANPYASPYNPSASGGGFMTDAAAGSPASKKKPNNTTARSVTCKQVLDSRQDSGENGSFTIDNAEIGLVTILGTVRKVSEQSTNISYTIDDGTDSLDARQWTNDSAGTENDFMASKRAAIRENSYVKVIGTIRSLNQRRGITIISITPISDYNEVTFHILDSIANHLYFTRGPPGNLKPMVGNDVNNPAYSAYAPPVQQQSYGFGNSDFSPVQQSIMRLVKTFDKSPDGVNIQMLIKKVTAEGFPAASVKYF